MAEWVEGLIAKDLSSIPRVVRLPRERHDAVTQINVFEIFKKMNHLLSTNEHFRQLISLTERKTDS